MRSLWLVLIAGCHFGWSTWQGATPRRTNAVTIALYTPNERSKSLAHTVLARDSHVTAVDVDYAALDPQHRASCTEGTCWVPQEAGCAWAKAHQLDYYAAASAFDTYDQTYVCTAYSHSLGDILDGKDEDDGTCTAGHYEGQHSTATFTLDIYRADTCELEPSVTTKVVSLEAGEEAQSRPAARMKLDREAPEKTRRFPDQIEVTAVRTADAADGYYAMYRDRRYRGFVAVKDDTLRSLHCCDEPRPGDQLVARGPRKLVELALDAVVGSITFDGERRGAGGPGIHLRYYPLDHGVRFGFGLDVLSNPYVHASALVMSPEIGWGFRPSSAFSLSANVAFGWIQAHQVIESMNDVSPLAVTPQLYATLRAVTFFTSWWYVGGDIGYLYSGDLGAGDWEGDGAGAAKPMSVRTPMARIWIGVDL